MNFIFIVFFIIYILTGLPKYFNYCNLLGLLLCFMRHGTKCSYSELLFYFLLNIYLNLLAIEEILTQNFLVNFKMYYNETARNTLN